MSTVTATFPAYVTEDEAAKLDERFGLHERECDYRVQAELLAKEAGDGWTVIATDDPTNDWLCDALHHARHEVNEEIEAAGLEGVNSAWAWRALVGMSGVAQITFEFHNIFGVQENCYAFLARDVDLPQIAAAAAAIWRNPEKREACEMPF